MTVGKDAQMRVEVVDRVPSTLPADDAHPYRTGAWRPNTIEYDAYDLDVIDGEIPADLTGVYLRNTENPVHEAIGLYHPFDGDGMLHMIAFADGSASYRNRFIRTDGFAAEHDAAASLWAGLLASPDDSVRSDGWGARGRMKDASSTDVVVHRGRAITSFYQCGDLYAHDPRTLAQLGKETWVPPEGISAHTKVDEHTGEMLVFNYGKDAPYMHYGVVDAAGALAHYTPIPLPGPRLPHDMAFTERFAILNDLPLFWDPQLLRDHNAHVPRFFADIPSRFAVIPRRGTAEDIRWFEAEPTYVLHWINAYEDGDEIVLDGFLQRQPEPPKRPDSRRFASIYRYLDLHQLQTVPHRWRFKLTTGATTEHDLSDDIMEFGMIANAHAGRPYRYSYNMTGVEGWFLFDGLVKHDTMSGATSRYAFDEGVFASETPFAPRPNATGEDDGYLVTFTTDVNADESRCEIFDATDITAGPVARVRLPERIASGTHSYWMAG
jgi:carotenoid cleavage dioxygenase-like enzyme